MPRKVPLPGPQARIAAALERLVALYELELSSKGLVTQEGSFEGEILTTDEDLLAQKEYEENVRTSLGLAPGAAVGPIDPETGREWATPAFEEEKGPSPEDLSSFLAFGAANGAWGLGPEGQESPAQATDPQGNPGA